MILTIKKNHHQACSAVGCCSKESSEVPLICNNHSWFPLSVNCRCFRCFFFEGRTYSNTILPLYLAYVESFHISGEQRGRLSLAVGCFHISRHVLGPWATLPPLSSMEYGKQLTTKIDANLDSKLCQSIFTQSLPKPFEYYLQQDSNFFQKSI